MTITRFYKRYLETEKTVHEIKAKVDSIDAIIAEMLAEDAPKTYKRLTPEEVFRKNDADSNTDEEGSDNCLEREDVVYAEEDPSQWVDIIEDIDDGEMTQEELEEILKEAAEIEALQMQVLREEEEAEEAARMYAHGYVAGYDEGYTYGWDDCYEYVDPTYDCPPEEEPAEI